MGITDWPENDRPRERLLQKGPDCLSDAELLAIFLRTGKKDISAVELGRTLIDRFGSLNALCRASDNDILSVKGIGPAKLCQIKAIIEFAKRCLIEKAKAAALDESFELFDILKYSSSKEEFWIVLLDNQNRLIEMITTTGTATKANISFRAISDQIAKHSPAKILFAHNHPSGDAQPSTCDHDLTEKLFVFCKDLEVLMLDHIIVSNNDLYSFSRSGMMPALGRTM